MKKIKMLFAINNLKFGGAPAVVTSQALGLDPEQFEVHVMSLHHNTSPGYFEMLSKRVSVHAFPLKKYSLFDVPTLWKIFKYLRKQRFDVVYTHLFLCNFLVRALAILARVPVRIAFEHSAYTNKSRWQIWADRLLARWTQRIVVSTPAVATFTAQQQHLAADKFSVIVNPVVLPRVVDTKRPSLCQELGVADDQFLVVSLGRYSEEKGLLYLIQAMAEIKEPQIVCRLLGYGAMQEQLQAEIGRLQLDARCTLVVQPDRAQ